MISGITPQKIFKLCSIIWDIMADKFYSAVNPPSRDDPVCSKIHKDPNIIPPIWKLAHKEVQICKILRTILASGSIIPFNNLAQMIPYYKKAPITATHY